MTSLLASVNLQVNSGVKIIALCGKSGSGKSTAASFITSNYKNCYETAFASKLKEIAAVAFEVPESHFYDAELKEQIIPDWGITPRQAAQFLGTELFRNHIHKDFWLAHVTNELNRIDPETGEFVYTPEDTVIISDLRFQNEYDWVMANGGIVIYIKRPVSDASSPVSGIPNHASEDISSINLHHPERTFTILNQGTLQYFRQMIGKLFVDLLTPGS